MKNAFFVLMICSFAIQSNAKAERPTLSINQFLSGKPVDCVIDHTGLGLTLIQVKSLPSVSPNPIKLSLEIAPGNSRENEFEINYNAKMMDPNSTNLINMKSYYRVRTDSQLVQTNTSRVKMHKRHTASTPWFNSKFKGIADRPSGRVDALQSLILESDQLAKAMTSDFASAAVAVAYFQQITSAPGFCQSLTRR